MTKTGSRRHHRISALSARDSHLSISLPQYSTKIIRTFSKIWTPSLQNRINCWVLTSRIFPYIQFSILNSIRANISYSLFLDRTDWGLFSMIFRISLYGLDFHQEFMRFFLLLCFAMIYCFPFLFHIQRITLEFLLTVYSVWLEVILPF